VPIYRQFFGAFKIFFYNIMFIKELCISDVKMDKGILNEQKDRMNGLILGIPYQYLTSPPFPEIPQTAASAASRRQ
jgi:hypothetical protein